MQAATSSRWTFFRYRLLSRFAEVLPMSARQPLAQLVARIAIPLSRDRVHVVSSHLEQIMKRPPTQREIRIAFASYIRYWLEAFHLPVLPKERLLSIPVEGRQYLERAKVDGKGAILLMPHIGNWDVAGAWSAASGFPPTTVAERLSPPELNQWFIDFRASIGMTTLQQSSRVALSLLRVLRENGFVALVGDRDVDGTGIPATFFGKVTRVPAGAAALALRSGAPIIPVACFTEGATRFRLVAKEPIPYDDLAGKRDAVSELTQRCVHEMESLIAREPLQWHVFVPLWPENDTVDDAAIDTAGDNVDNPSANDPIEDS